MKKTIAKASPKKSPPRWLKPSLLFTGVVLLCASIVALLQPIYSDVRYRIDTADWQAASIPFDRVGDGTVELEFTMHLRWPVANLFTVLPNDCLESIIINNQSVQSTQLPFCHHKIARRLWLGSHLHLGRNTVQVRLRNHSGPIAFTVAVSRLDPIMSATVALFITSFVLYLCALRRSFKFFKKLTGAQLLVWFVLAVAVAVRVGYVWMTHYDTRGHDTGGHIEYIEYVADHWRLPKASEGWEFYQPPLYYGLGASWMSLARWLGLSRDSIIRGIEAGSLLLSLGMICLAYKVATMVYRTKGESWQRGIWMALLLSTPVLIFSTTRINNDVLVQCLLWLAFVWLLRWWQLSKERDWYVVALLAALAMLAKSNAILFVPVLFLCLAFRQGIGWTAKLRLAAVAVVVVLSVTGWHSAQRFMIERHSSVVGNIGSLNGSLRVDGRLATLLVFNPLRVLTQPYNNPWEDSAGRQYFWEYFYRSVFFGEFQFGSSLRLLCSSILFLGLVNVVLMFIGIIRSFFKQWYKDLPWLLTLLFIAGGQIAYRQTAPFSTSQDFRYSTLALLPASYFILRGIDIFPRRFQNCARAFVIGLAGLCTIFVVTISLQGI